MRVPYNLNVKNKTFSYENSKIIYTYDLNDCFGCCRKPIFIAV